jgi:hypothetical protein
VGDESAAIELVPGITDGSQFVELRDGDALPLVAPPQGGHVSFVGARARNVDPCRAHIAATVRSPRTTKIIAEESRNVRMAPVASGWGEPNPLDISSFANVPLCPDYHDESIVDTEYTLELRLVDTRGDALGGSATRMVVPRCLQGDAYQNALCRCECRADYTLGSCANPLEAGDER